MTNRFQACVWIPASNDRQLPRSATWPTSDLGRDNHRFIKRENSFSLLFMDRATLQIFYEKWRFWRRLMLHTYSWFSLSSNHISYNWQYIFLWMCTHVKSFKSKKKKIHLYLFYMFKDAKNLEFVRHNFTHNWSNWTSGRFINSLITDLWKEF